jgi:exonuclease SbcD
MVKVIHSGDFHLGGSYPEKAQVSAQFLIDQIHDRESLAYNPDVILLGGDLTDRALHVHSDRLQPFYNLVKSVTCPIVLLQGTVSHEPLGTINNIAALADNVHVIDSPSQELTFGDLLVMGLPGLTKPQLKKWMVEAGSDIDGFDDPTAAIQLLLQKIGERFAKHDGPKVLMGHWTLSGCTTSTGQTMLGSDLEVGLADLKVTGASATLLNHIHRAQDWDKPVFASYSGPPYPTSWGETDTKSFTVFQFLGPDDMAFRRINFPHKPMMKIDVVFNGEQKDGEWQWALADGQELTPELVARLQISEVKVCYSVPKAIAAQVDDMIIRLNFAKMMIELAAIERKQLATERDQIDGIALKETTRSQYEASCAAKGEEPRPGALELADQMDTEGVGR